MSCADSQRDVDGLSARTDGDLIAAYVARDDQAAFTELVRRHSGLVLGVARRRLRDEDLAREVAQEVFAILARKASGLRDAAGLGAWLHRVALNRVMKRIERMTRERRRWLEFAQLQGIETAGRDPMGEVWPLLDPALDSLADQDRQLLTLRYHEGLSFAEAARRMGKGEAALRQRAGRALEKMALFLRKRGVRVSGGAVAGALTSGLGGPIPSAEAAALAAAAIQGVPLIDATTLAAITFTTMKTTHAMLIAAAAMLAVTSVPITLQRQERQKIERRLAQANAELLGLRASAKDVAGPKAAAPALPGTTAKASGGRAEASRPSGDAMARLEKQWKPIMVASLTHEADVMVGRMSAALGLTDAETAAYRKFMRDLMEEQVGSRVLVGSDQYRVKREEWQRREEEFVRALVGPERAAGFSQVVHRRNAERVEHAAYQALHRFTRALDLTDEQKDSLFQELSRRAWDGVGARTQRNFVLNYTPSISDLPKVDEAAAAAAVLSPGQVAAWQKHVKDEGEFTERMTKKVMPIFMPGLDPSDLPPRSPEAKGNM